MSKLLRNVWQDEAGQDIAEYAILLAVIALVVIVAVTSIGTNANAIFQSIAGKLSTAAGTTAPPAGN